MAVTLRGPRLTLLLLFTVCLALASGQLWNSLNDLFRKNHENFPKLVAINDNAYCNRMMWNRFIYSKYTNTFINAPEEDINKVCTTAGTPSGIYKQESTEKFNITVCTYIPWTISYTGISAKAKIVLLCTDGLPVLFVKPIMQ